MLRDGGEKLAKTGQKSVRGEEINELRGGNKERVSQSAVKMPTVGCRVRG